MHKSLQNPPKSKENRWKLRLGLVPGALGEALGVILAPKACLRQQREARCPKMHRKWVPIWRSIAVIFLICWGLFFNTFFESLRTSLFIDFWSILVSILDPFLVLFLNLWISSFLQPLSSENLIFEGPSLSFLDLFCYAFGILSWNPIFCRFWTILGSMLASIFEHFGDVLSIEILVKKWRPTKHQKRRKIAPT